MNFLNKIIHDDSDNAGNIKYKFNKKTQNITPHYRKSSIDNISNIVSTIHFKDGKSILLIGICGGQASGKKKISEYFHNHIKRSETICEMSFFKPNEKDRQLSKEDEYLAKDYNFYSKDRRLYLIDICNPDFYDYEKFYNVLKKLSEGEKVQIPYFDEKEFKFNPEKDKIIDPIKTPLIIIDGYFIFKNQKIRELLNLKIFKEVEDDVRLSRLVLREEKFLKNNYDAYEIFFAIYERFYKKCFDEIILPYKKYANILLPDYNVTEDDVIEGDEALEFLLSNLNNLSK